MWACVCSVRWQNIITTTLSSSSSSFILSIFYLCCFVFSLSLCCSSLLHLSVKTYIVRMQSKVAFCAHSFTICSFKWWWLLLHLKLNTYVLALCRSLYLCVCLLYTTITRYNALFPYVFGIEASCFAAQREWTQANNNNTRRSINFHSIGQQSYLVRFS